MQSASNSCSTYTPTHSNTRHIQLCVHSSKIFRVCGSCWKEWKVPHKDDVRGCVRSSTDPCTSYAQTPHPQTTYTEASNACSHPVPILGRALRLV